MDLFQKQDMNDMYSYYQIAGASDGILHVAVLPVFPQLTGVL